MFTCDIRHPVFNVLETSPYTFYPTGSRFFGTATEQSDWDFFAKDCAGIRNELKELGFIELKQKEQYSDSYLKTLFVHIEAQIHVQLYDDPVAKNNAQNLIRKYNFYKLKKRYMSILWSMLIEACSE